MDLKEAASLHGSATVPLVPLSTTPRRHPASLADRTPNNSLNWPSAVRRSVSTRESSVYSNSRASSGVRRGTGSVVQDVSRCASSGGRVRAGGSACGGFAPPLVDVPDSTDRSSVCAHSHSRCTSIGTPRNVSSPPPVEQFEADAAKMSRGALLAEVEELRTENRVLKTSVLRAREAHIALQEGMKDNYTSAERRQENIANTLMRRLNRAKAHRERLTAHLVSVEARKVRQEEKLLSTQKSIAQLTRRLKREEHAITSRMQEQLRQLQGQRQQLERMLGEQAQSLQDLEELVNEAHKMAPSSLSRQDSSWLSSVASTPAARPAPAEEQQSSPSYRPRSNSQLSTSSAPDTAPYCSTEMISYLETEISSVEVLRSDARERAENYSRRSKKLEQRIADELRAKEQQQQSVRAAQHDVNEVTGAVKNLSMVQEMSFEMEADRRFNLGRCEAASTVTNSSLAATPGAFSAMRTGEQLDEQLLLPLSTAQTSSPQQITPLSKDQQLAHGTASATTTTAVNLSDVMLVPGTEKYMMIPARGGGEGQEFSALMGATRDAPADALVRALLVPHPSKFAVPASADAKTTPAVPTTPGTRSAMRVHDTSRMTPAKVLTSPEGTPRIASSAPQSECAEPPQFDLV